MSFDGRSYITDWPAGVYAGDDAAIARSKAAHPAGKKLDAPAPETDAEALASWVVGGWRSERRMEDILTGRYPTPEPLPEFDEHVYEIVSDLAALLITKQADYGPRAINDSPGGAVNGINVRLHDKLSRAINLHVRVEGPTHESLRDTYRDIANYAIIATMVLDGTWPE